MKENVKKNVLFFVALLGTSLYFLEKSIFFLVFSSLLVVLSFFYAYSLRKRILTAIFLVSFFSFVFFIFKESYYYSAFFIFLLLLSLYLLLDRSRGGVVRYPNPVLRKRAEKLSASENSDFIEKMIDMVIEEEGAGLAAPQIGISKRVIVVNSGDGVLHLINPKITPDGTEKITFKEGCLSLKGVWIDVQRFSKITVEAENKEGETFLMEAEGIMSVIIQHEVDHLDGVLIIDHLPFLRKTKEIVKYFIREYLW